MLECLKEKKSIGRKNMESIKFNLKNKRLHEEKEQFQV